MLSNHEVLSVETLHEIGLFQQEYVWWVFFLGGGGGTEGTDWDTTCLDTFTLKLPEGKCDYFV